MAKPDLKKTSTKRKHSEKDDDVAPVAPVTLKLAGLEMLTDDEDDEYDPNAETDGEVDEFPEINPSSDSEGEEEDDSEDGSDVEDISGEEDESEEEDSEPDSDDHSIFPKAKTIISDITGQPKTVYPEIEPEYDSDSSTEEVCPLHPHLREQK